MISSVLKIACEKKSSMWIEFQNVKIRSSEHCQKEVIIVHVTPNEGMKYGPCDEHRERRII